MKNTLDTNDPKDANKKRKLEDNNNGHLAILITECLQNDYFVNIDDTLKKVYVGNEFSKRILGNEEESPLNSFINWTRSDCLKDKLEIIHVRDWHDPNDLDQKDHLERFGMHCLKDTPGAKLLYDMEEHAKNSENEYIVNAVGLNDVEETNLVQTLEHIKNKPKHKGKRIRIGVIGCWTEGKISCLVYDLCTRLKYKEISICSILTASKTFLNQEEALERIDTMFNTHIIHTISEFTQWLCKSEYSFSGSNNNVELNFVDDKKVEDLSENQKAILHYMFQNCKRVNLKVLGGGFSGASVFLAVGFDKNNMEQVPTVIKIGDRKKIIKERLNCERVQDVLGNNCPRILTFADSKCQSGIKFAYAGFMGKVTSFKSIYMEGVLDAKEINNIIGILFYEILNKFYDRSVIVRMNLFEMYDFDGKGWSWGQGGTDTPDKVAERVVTLMKVEDGTVKDLVFDEFQVENVYHFLKDIHIYREKGLFYHHLAFNHGDLHGENICLDSYKNISLIDFEFCEKSHLLKDITKLLNDIIFFYTPINHEKELCEHYKIVFYLFSIKDLKISHPESLIGVTSPHMVRTWLVVRFLLECIAHHMKHKRTYYDVAVPMLRYCLHTICLPSTKFAKLSALFGACGFAQSIKKSKRFTTVGYPIFQIPNQSEIYDNDGVMGSLAFSYRLGINESGNNMVAKLEEDIQQISCNGVDYVFDLCCSFENTNVKDIERISHNRGLKYEQFPLLPRSGIDKEALKPFLLKIIDLLKNKNNILFISYIGLGRAPLVISSLLLELNPKLDPMNILVNLRSIRNDQKIPETKDQEESIINYN